MRSTLIAGNWKMNGTRSETAELLRALLACPPPPDRIGVAVFPPFTALQDASQLLAGSWIRLGAQDVFWETSGAYTGQISPAMLCDLGCVYVIVGHSERRGRFGVPDADFTGPVAAYFGDNDVTVNMKLRALIAAGLRPICCVGETLAERRSGQTDAVVARQVHAALRDVDMQGVRDLTFAYEPVWAIGTGEVCAAPEAARLCALVRSESGAACAGAALPEIRVLYGGSVQPQNAGAILAEPDVDGALVGGASLTPSAFAAIIAAAPAT